jgi:gluconolactonase
MAFRRQPSGRTLGTAAGAAAIGAILTVCQVVAASCASTGISRPAAGRTERLDPRLDALIPAGAALETVADGLEWAEGPVWDASRGGLLFSDVPRNVVLLWKEGSGVAEVIRPSGYTGKERFKGREPGSNGLAFDRQGRLVLCQHGDRRVARLEPDGSFTVLADRYDGKRLNSPNDLVFRSNGDLYFTDPPYGLPGAFEDPDKELPYQGVYRVTPEGKVSLMTRELSSPNGIAFSPDEKTLYVSNSDPKKPIWMAYPVLADGSLGPGRQFAEARAWVREGEGLPDGLKSDRNGNLFATGPGGIHVFAPDGTRLGRIETGDRTGNVNWGEDGSVLFLAANHRILRLRTTTKGKGF